MPRRDSGLALLNPSVSLASQLTQIELPTEVLSLLAGYTSTSTDANAIFGTIYNALNDVTIQVHNHELADDLMQRRGPFKLEQMSLFVRYFVYLSSNNLVADKKIDKLVEWMVESKTEWVLDLLLDLRTQTTEIFGSNILVSAARLGSIDVVRSLIARGVDVEAFAGTSFRRTALEEAVHYRHPRIVELLLKEGAKLQTPFTPGFSFLLETLGGPHALEIFKMLFNKCADVNDVGDSYARAWPCLPFAVGLGNHGIIRFLLQAGADIDATDPDCGTALQFAVVCEDVEAVQILIDAGADIDATAGDLVFENEENEENYRLLRTPIQQASLAENAEIVQILVDKGADVNAFQWDDYDTPIPWQEYRRHQWESCSEFADTQSYQDIMMTPLQAAVFRRNPVIVRILLAVGAHVDAEGFGDTPFQMAAALNDGRIMQILRRHGANVNAPAADDDGMTALQAAARAGHCKLVQEMLVSGSDINAAACPRGGRTALQAAAEGENVDLAKILIEAGANVNADASPINGRTCLQAAAEGENVDLAKILIEVGANVNADASPINGRTCLQAAVEQRHVEMVLVLLNAGADVNGSAAKISGGLTAFQAALGPFNDDDEEPDICKNEQSRDTILQALFDAGADVSAPSSPQRGMIPILGAVDTGKPGLVRLCLQGGADPNISAGGVTALGAAVYQGSAEVVTLLIEGGADVNAYCKMYYPTDWCADLILWSALHVAAATGRIDIANLLLEAGADINLQHHATLASTALQPAIASNSILMVQFLLSKGAAFHACGVGWRPHVIRVLHGSVGMDILNALAVADVDFNQIADAYELAFDEEDIQRWMDSGALMHWTAEQKGHLLQAVIKQGYSDLVKGMLDAGADVNTSSRGKSTWCQSINTSSQGWTALQRVNTSSRGRTALQRAAEQGYTDTVTLLLSYGADVNAPAADCWGITALEGAALNGNLKIVFILLKAGAEIDPAPGDRYANTALRAAAGHGHLDIVSLLLDNYHDKEVMDLHCDGAVYKAESRGHKVIARFLREHQSGQDSTE